MSRLIDADKLIEEISKWYWDKEKQKASEEDVSPMDLFTHLAITTVQEQPTTYDKLYRYDSGQRGKIVYLRTF